MTATLPVLHVAETVVRVTVLDWRVLLAGAALFALAAGAIWWPQDTRGRFIRRGPTLPAARAAVVVLAFFAVLPSAVPYDHLLLPPHDGHEDAHTLHCHGTPAECADAPIPAGPGQMLAAEPLVVVPAMLSLVLVISVLTMAGWTRRPELQPPMRLIPA